MVSVGRFIISQILLWFATVIMVLVIIAGGYVFIIAARLPLVDSVGSYRPTLVSSVVGSDGRVIGEFGGEKRIIIPLDKMAPVMIKAFIAAEDAGFYGHSGIDLGGIVRAGIKNALSFSKKEGGSTITQQVTRMLLLTPEKNFSRKIKEIILAIRIEGRLAKNEILHIYLNQIYLGAGAYGVEAASRIYFGKSAADLSLGEAALLAGLPKAPNNYSPLKNPQKAKARQAYVLGQMVKNGHISQAEAAAAASAELKLAQQRQGNAAAMAYPLEMVRSQLEGLVGSAVLLEGGLTIETTIDSTQQRGAWRAVRRGIDSIDRRGHYRGPLQRADVQGLKTLAGQPAAPDPDQIYQATVTAVDRRGNITLSIGGITGQIRRDSLWPGATVASACPPEPGAAICPGAVVLVLAPVADWQQLQLTQAPELQGALVALDAASGDIRALVGGYDFKKSQFNRATQARRQAGSTFKPFVYAAAISEGFAADSIFDDLPLEFPDGLGGSWQPRNYDDDYRGPVSMREALTRSINMVSIRIMEAVGPAKAAQYAARFGFTGLESSLTLALGATPVTPLELATAYGVFADSGRRKPARLLLRVRDRGGRILYDAGPPQAVEVIDPAVAAEVTSMLYGVVESGTGRLASSLGSKVAGKTGTTNDSRDAWFAGFYKGLVATVWVGYDQEHSIGAWASGGAAALPIWVEFMKAALLNEGQKSPVIKALPVAPS